MRTNGQPGQFWWIHSEGAYIPGGSKQPNMEHGLEWGVTLLEACRTLAKRDNKFALNFNPRTMLWWNCKIYAVDTRTEKRITPEKLIELETYFKAWQKAKEDLG